MPRTSVQFDSIQSLGNSLTGAAKALALGPMYRQQAEQAAMLNSAKLAQSAAVARKYDASAALDNAQLQNQQNPLQNAMLSLGLPTAMAPAFRQRLETGSFGPSYDTPVDGVGPVMPAPADNDTVAKLGRAIALTQRMYGTGSKVDQMAKASEIEQTMSDRGAIIANAGLAMPTSQAYFATSGKAPFGDADPGLSRNLLNGSMVVGNERRASADIEEVVSRMLENKAQANSANASAGKYTAEADIERQKADRLRTTGALPGTGAEGSEGALSSTILNTLKVPALDAKGRPVRNPITGELETVVDQDAQKSFYQWADQNKRKPTATAFSQWEAQGRPGANKNPPPAAAQPTIVQAPPAQQRKPNTVYQTPKGPMKWTGTGWLPAN